MRTICTLRTTVNGHPDSLRSLLLHPWAPPLSLMLHPDFSCTFVPYFQLLLDIYVPVAPELPWVSMSQTEFSPSPTTAFSP